MSIRISKSTGKLAFRLFFSVTVMRIIIEYVYVTQIAVIYRYSGFQNDFDLTRCIVSWVMMYSLLPFIVYFAEKPNFSKTVLYIVYLLSYVPGTVFMTYMDLSYILPWYTYYLLLFAFECLVKKPVAVPRHRYMSKRSIYFLAGMFSGVILFIWLYYAHGRIQLGLDDVYSIRLEARTYGMPMVIRYIFASMKIALPVFVVWSIKSKNKALSVIFGLVHLLIFFVDGSKSTLFSLVVSIGGYYFLHNHIRRIQLFPLLLAAVGILGIAEFFLIHTYSITGIFIRRTMFVPQYLNIFYYRFFTENTPDFFRGSILKILGFTSPYGGIPRMIGKYYFGSDTLAANNGLFSDAYANLGAAGIFLMPFAIVVLLKFIDIYTNDFEVDTLIGSIAAFTPALISASFFTLFLTHGVVAIFLIFYFIPRNDEAELTSYDST